MKNIPKALENYKIFKKVVNIEKIVFITYITTSTKDRKCINIFFLLNISRKLTNFISASLIIIIIMI